MSTICGLLIRKAGRLDACCSSLLAVVAGFFGSRLPAGFLPQEDQGYVYV